MREITEQEQNKETLLAVEWMHMQKFQDIVVQHIRNNEICERMSMQH